MQHKELSKGRWLELSLCQQMANIGAEVGRAIIWKNKDRKYSEKAVERALELLYFSIDDGKNKSRLKELTRVYECLGDYFYGNNEFKSSNELWNNYFYNFAYAAKVNKK